MFTGIIEARGEVIGLDTSGSFVTIHVRTDLDLSDVKEGDSICVDGACLTATRIDMSRSELAADVSPETLQVTTLGVLKIGARVNLEKAMRMDSRLGGHLVSGHVDCVGRIVEKRPTGMGYFVGFLVDSGRYLIEKGSVAVDGISLTVNRVTDGRFWIMIIPHTAALTGLTEKNINDKVNIEFDLIGKYVEKFLLSGRRGSGLDERTLREHGFM
jgi:riboflavin synthase